MKILHRVLLVCCVTLITVLPDSSQGRGEDIAIFRLTDYDAYLESRIRYEKTENQSTGTVSILDNLRQERELGFSTRSYIYHPNLVDMVFTGGVLWDSNNIDRQQTALANNATDNIDSTRLLWNMSANLQLLKNKPYPLTLNYYRENPLLNTGLEGSFTHEVERYGLNLGLYDILPMRLTLNASRTTSSGETLDRIIDNMVDTIVVNATRSLKGNHNLSFNYALNRQHSRDGVLDRPIRETKRLSHRMTMGQDWRFGSNKQYYLNNRFSVNLRDNPEVLDIRYDPSFRWTYSDRIESTYRYNFSFSERPEFGLRNTQNRASARLRYRHDDRIGGTFMLRGNQSSEASGVDQVGYGSTATAYYSRTVPFGDWSVNGSLNYDYRDRQTSVATISIRDETIRLNGIEPERLREEFIIPGSVIVRNEAQTQTFIEDIDYRLVTIGARTEIQRLASGAILDGENLLVDYEVNSGGSFAYSVLGRSLNTELRLAKHYAVYVRYQGNDQSVSSGSPTRPLNSLNRVEIGSRADVPLPWWGLQAGGEISFLTQDEDINPYDQFEFDSFVQVPLPYRLALRLSAQKYITDNKNSPEDQDLTRITAILRWNARRNLIVTAELNKEEDTGGTQTRSLTQAALRASWRYRRLRVSAEARYDSEQQGLFQRDFWRFYLTVRREFF